MDWPVFLPLPGFLLTLSLFPLPHLRKKKENVNQGVRLLNDSYKEKKKITIISLLWKVLIADGKVDKSESRYLEQIKNRLHLTEAQIEAGKLQARKSPVG